MTKRNNTVGITIPIGPLGLSLCVKRWVIGGAIGIRKRVR